MANNRDNNINIPEETEYHFSDEDITYEAEPEEQVTVKPAVVKPPVTNILSQLSSKQRIGMSIVIFLVLLFIVYKIISPSEKAGPQLTSTPIPPVTTVAQAPSLPAQVPQTPPAPIVAAPTPPVALPAATQSVVNQMNPTPSASQALITTTNPMPPVMPVTSAPPTYPASSPAVENSSNQLTAINNQLVSQMQADYTQKLADMSQQNKRLEDDVQKLSASIASMETRINQLVQLMLNQQREAQQVKETNAVQSNNASPKLPYTVQAIIPGRAWLRSDQGDTITVTEGDVLKDIGKVSKIDPYDGVVEINTGRKVISLSYGNGG